MLPENIAYRSPRVLSYLATAAIAIVALMCVASGVIAVGQILDPSHVVHLDKSTVSLWLILQSFAILFHFGVFIVAAVIFLIWLNRANKNLTPLKAQYVEFSSGWAVGWWFIPFANLVKPFQVVREVWWESDPDRGDEKTMLTTSLHQAPTYLGFWWASWLVMNILDNIAGRVFDPEKLESVAITGYLFLASSIVAVVASFLVIYLLHDITQRQDERFRRLYPVQPGYTPPPYLGKYGEI